MEADGTYISLSDQRKPGDLSMENWRIIRS